MDEVIDYSERMMRAALARLPDGEAGFDDFFDGDGVLAPGARRRRAVHGPADDPQAGRHDHRRFRRLRPAVPGPMNAPLTVTASGVYCALKMIADPKSLIPPNSGCWRPVTVTAPPGSVVNAAAAGAGRLRQPRDLAPRRRHGDGGDGADPPDTVMACSQGTSAVITFGGVDPRTGERYVSYESLKGGFGARPVKDGINAVASTVSNMMNTPIEILEMSFPLRVEEYALVPDSGGAGRWRGGLGARRVWRVLGRNARGGARGGVLRAHRDAAVRAGRRA